MMDGLRLSALALHAVADCDRAWLLSRLPGAQRVQLSALVDELRGIGVPADSELVRQLVREREVPECNAAAEARLARAGVEEIWALLRAESDAVICRIARRRDWPWKSALLALCGPGRAARIQALTDRLAHAVALDQALVSALDQRLDVRQSTHAGAQSARWQFLRRTRRSV